jgi:hypothetical protein
MESSVIKETRLPQCREKAEQESLSGSQHHYHPTQHNPRVLIRSSTSHEAELLGNPSLWLINVLDFVAPGFTPRIGGNAKSNNFTFSPKIRLYFNRW